MTNDLPSASYLYLMSGVDNLRPLNRDTIEEFLDRRKKFSDIDWLASWLARLKFGGADRAKPRMATMPYPKEVVTYEAHARKMQVASKELEAVNAKVYWRCKLRTPWRLAKMRVIWSVRRPRRASAGKEGTVSSRLNRARQPLQQQLARRGIELSALLAALAVAESAAQAGVPAVLASATLRSGLLVAAGGTAAGVIPAHVATLVAGVTRAMFLTKAKFATGTSLRAYR